MWYVEDAQVNESFWVAPVTHRKHYTRPVLFRRGYLNILREGDWCYEKHSWTQEQTIKTMGNCGR